MGSKNRAIPMCPVKRAKESQMEAIKHLSIELRYLNSKLSDMDNVKKIEKMLDEIECVHQALKTSNESYQKIRRILDKDV